MTTAAKTTVQNPNLYVVRSCNFSWHEPIETASYEEALTAARGRGFEARIDRAGTLVATWSPLYGTHTYSRELAR